MSNITMTTVQFFIYDSNTVVNVYKTEHSLWVLLGFLQYI